MKRIIATLFIIFLTSCSSTQKELSSDDINTAIAQKNAVNTAIAQTIAAQPASPTNIPSGIPVKNTPSPTAIPTYTPTIAPTDTPTLTEILLPVIPNATIPNIDAAVCVPRNTKVQKGVVVNVVDGDTIDVQLEDGQIFRVRYIGMNTPETGEVCGSEATNINRTIVEGKQALMVVDVSEVDKYDRLLRYLFIDAIFVNYELVVQGFAQQVSYPPDIACAETFKDAQRIARENGRGCWAATPTFTPLPTLPPTVLPTQAPPPPPQAPQPTAKPTGDCDPSYPDVCIKSPPPDLDCGQIPYKRFRVLPPDPHRFDGDHDGIGCES